MRTLTTASAIAVQIAGAYADRESVGGKLTFNNGGRRSGSGGEVKTLRLVDQSMNMKILYLVLFNADPTNTTFTDHVELDIDDADMSKIVGVLALAATDYRRFKDNAVATLRNVGIGYQLSGSSKLYGALIAGEAVTYVAATDLALSLAVDQD